MNKIKWPALPQIRRTPLTRVIAALAALVLIAALVLVVERQVGNPFTARWTVHAINDALQAMPATLTRTANAAMSARCIRPARRMWAFPPT